MRLGIQLSYLVYRFMIKEMFHLTLCHAFSVIFYGYLNIFIIGIYMTSD